MPRIAAADTGILNRTNTTLTDRPRGVNGIDDADGGIAVAARFAYFAVFDSAVFDFAACDFVT